MAFTLHTYILFLISSFLLLIFNFLGLAYIPQSQFLDQPKPPLQCHYREKLALLRFKQSYVLNCDASTPPFAYPKVTTWHESGDCCRWAGVKCNKMTSHVVGLDLSSSCLFGNFPPNNTLFDLGHLLELNLADNDFNNSQIPSEISHLYKLNYLNLSLSVFSGKIPLEISKLSNLSVLDLSNNGQLGSDQFNLVLQDLSLESLVHDLAHLTELHLDQVEISSTMPFIFINRTSFKAISLRSCNLFGVVPSNLLRSPNLEQISLDYNSNLGGYLPEFPPNSPLKTLSLAGTNFSGELPASLGNLASLQVLQLDACGFFGSIPSSIGNLTNLTILTLSYNHLSGDLPSSIANITQLTILELSDVNVEPRLLTSWFPKLIALEQLSLDSMNIGNEIFPALANFTDRLFNLDMCNNKMTGPLPLWFGNFTKLVSLQLFNNQFQGSIPLWISKLVNLKRISLSFDNSSEGTFDSFLNLPHLKTLYLSHISILTFPNNTFTNSSLVKFDVLYLQSCNLTKFPEFLRYQNKLEDLSLNENNIAGYIPDWLANITKESLVYLDLSDNLLNGFEQPLDFLPWNNLESLNLNDNNFKGPLPYPPSSIQVFQASNNQFYGVIPELICEATSLVYLDLSNNNLSGKLSSCIGNQLGGSLQVLNLRGNKFDGNIFQEFSRACTLKMINLSKNQLQGKLPKSLVQCTMLEVLDVGTNRINDTFPYWLGSLSKLQVLVLSHNNFYGRMNPPSYGRDFHYLRIIDLSNNFYIGSLPWRYIQNWHAMTISSEDQAMSSKSDFKIHFALADGIVFEDERYNYGITIMNKGSETFYAKILTVFRVVDFSNNKFSGTIPESISELRGLQALNLSNNNLVGSISPSLANMTDLQSLDLSRNMLSGQIPQALTMINSLEIFNVSHNRLVGPIPQGQQFSTFDSSSFEGNSALCGPQLSVRCDSVNSATPAQQLVNDEMKEDEDTKLIDWIVRSLGCAGGLVVGYVIGKIYVADRHHDWFMETFGRRGKSKTKGRRSTQRRIGNR